MSTLNDQVTRQIREMEKKPDQWRFDRFLLWCCAKKVDLCAWSKRVDALKKKILLAEIHSS